MDNELLNNAVITRVSNATAAGTSAITSSVLDMSGFTAVCFIALLNTVTSTSVLTLTAYENTANSTSSPAPVAVTGGATPTLTDSGGASSNGVLVSDVIRPKDRYVFCKLTRTTANCAVDAILAIQYRAQTKPVTQPATVLESVISSPEV